VEVGLTRGELALAVGLFGIAVMAYCAAAGRGWAPKLGAGAIGAMGAGAATAWGTSLGVGIPLAFLLGFLVGIAAKTTPEKEP
jgi:hypothetical protein